MGGLRKGQMERSFMEGSDPGGCPLLLLFRGTCHETFPSMPFLV